MSFVSAILTFMAHVSFENRGVLEEGFCDDLGDENIMRHDIIKRTQCIDCIVGIEFTKWHFPIFSLYPTVDNQVQPGRGWYGRSDNVHQCYRRHDRHFECIRARYDLQGLVLWARKQGELRFGVNWSITIATSEEEAIMQRRVK